MTEVTADLSLHSLTKQIEDQERKLSTSLGRGTSQSIIDSATLVLASAPRHPDYIKFDQVPFVYEKLGGEKTNDAVKIVVDNWTQKPENIQRAANAVERNVATNATTDLVKAFCGFRFKALKRKWQPLHGLAINERERSTVVVIALEPLNCENGCFVNLRSGEDVCVDGNATVLIPGTGGGLGIFIDLEL